MLKLDKEKYLSILRADGLSAAITALHHDKNLLELETFEGSEGYRPDLWQEVQRYCDFSRELWDTALQEGMTAAPVHGR